jgi:hypothetical protein
MARTLGSSRTSTRPPGVLTKIRPPPQCRVQTAAEVTGRPWVNRAAVRLLAVSEATSWWNRRASARIVSAWGMVSSFSTRLADRTASAGNDAMRREPGHQPVQVGVRKGPVDPAVSFGLFGAEVVRAENRLHDAAPSQQPGQVLHAVRAWGRADTDLDLSQDGVLPCGEPHVASQRQFAARPAGPATDLRDRDDRQVAELVPQHAQGRIVRPARLGRFGGVLRDPVSAAPLPASL